MSENDPFIDVPAKEPAEVIPDAFLTQKYSEGNIQNPTVYSSSRPFYKVVVGPTRGKGVDFTDLQKAIDRVNLLGGGVIFIQAGTYTITSDITLYANIFLQGEDLTSTILDFANNNANLRFVGTSGSYIKNIRISHLQITRSAKVDEGALYMEYAQDIIIENVYFYNNSNSSDPICDILGGNTNKSLIIRNNIFDKSNQFIQFVVCQDVQIYNNQFRTLDVEGNPNILFADTIHLDIYNNYFSNVRGQAIFSEGPFQGVTIYGNTFVCSAAVTVHLPVIKLGAAENIIISNNNLYLNFEGGNGIFLDSAGYVQILGNFINDGTQSGIFITSGNFNIISNNIIAGCQAYGLDISNASSTKNIVTSNQFKANSSGGLHDSGTSTTSANNITA